MANENVDDYRPGLRLAALYLSKTAADYEEMGSRIQPKGLSDSVQRKELLNKAQLLRGQADKLKSLSAFEVSYLLRESAA